MPALRRVKFASPRTLHIARDLQRTPHHSRAGRRTRPQAGRVPAHSRPDRPRAELHRARHLLGDVERALLVQVLEGASAQPADQGALGDPGAGRERRRDRHRRRARRRVQDGEPQPPELHRALSGRGDRRRRHPARRVHHGRAADRLPQCAVASAIRTIPRPAIWCPAWWRASAATAIRSACRRSAARCASTPATTATTWSTPWRSASPRSRQDFLRGGLRRRHADRLSRLEDRTRRHPRRQHGLGRIRRGRRGEASDRAGRRSVLREAAARSLPGDHGQGLRHRHPGHGRGGADLLGGRDGRQGRSRRRSRTRQGAVPRDRHERLRDDALGEPGAHAHGAQAREGSRGRGDLPQMGARLRHRRPHHAEQALHRQARAAT